MVSSIRKVLPSMRSMQFGGKPIEVAPNRIYNCAFAPIDDWRVFQRRLCFFSSEELAWDIVCRKHHVEKLPVDSKAKLQKELAGSWLMIPLKGWADAVKALVQLILSRVDLRLRFDYSDIRPKGARLVTSGGKAPGPQPLKECLVKLQGMFEAKENGDKLTTIEAHDMICHIADAVLGWWHPSCCTYLSCSLLMTTK